MKISSERLKKLITEELEKLLSEEEDWFCRDCDGTGKYLNWDSQLMTMVPSSLPCEKCGGSGKPPSPKPAPPVMKPASTAKKPVPEPVSFGENKKLNHNKLRQIVIEELKNLVNK